MEHIENKDFFAVLAFQIHFGGNCLIDKMLIKFNNIIIAKGFESVLSNAWIDGALS